MHSIISRGEPYEIIYYFTEQVDCKRRERGTFQLSAFYNCHILKSITHRFRIHIIRKFKHLLSKHFPI